MRTAQSRDESQRPSAPDGGSRPLDRQLLDPHSALETPALPSQIFKDYHQTPPASALASFKTSTTAFSAATQDVDETEDSSALAIALDAPSAPRPGGNTSQIYIGR